MSAGSIGDSECANQEDGKEKVQQGVESQYQEAIKQRSEERDDETTIKQRPDETQRQTIVWSDIWPIKL